MNRPGDAGTVPDGSELLIGSEVPDAQKEPGHLHQSRRQDRAAVQKFARRVALFMAPIILFAALVELLLWHMGESWPLERVIHFQENHPQAYYSRGMLDEGTFRYKYLQLLRRHLQVVALGSSRVMQFRAEMFGSKGAAFYNAGGLIHSVNDLQQFVDRLHPGNMPQVVILGIDFWWFNANVKNELFDAFEVGVNDEGTYSWEGHATAVSEVVRHPRSLRRLVTYNFPPRYNPDAIGVRAQLNHSGFRLDGSKRFELKVPNTEEGWKKRALGKKDEEKLAKGLVRQVPFTDGISLPLLEQFRTVLSKLKASGVFIVAYSPPLLNDWARIVSNTPQERELWEQYHQQLPEVFRSLDIPFWDVVTPETIGLSDRFMRDPYHAYETLDVHLLQLFCQDERVRQLFPETPKIVEETLASPRTNPLYPDLPGNDSPKK